MCDKSCENCFISRREFLGATAGLAIALAGCEVIGTGKQYPAEKKKAIQERKLKKWII